jgi:Zn-dependent alcohol dehydrogenase
MACAVLTSCGATVINSSTTTESSTTTTLPSGDITSLVTEIHDAASNIGALIISADTARAHDYLNVALGAWQVLEPQLAQITAKDDGNTADSLKRVIGLLTTAVNRKRPADADKAEKFSALILESLPALLQ